MTAALSGTSTDRKTIISSRNDRPTTAMMKSGSRAESRSLMSMNAAVWPVDVGRGARALQRLRQHVVAQVVDERLRGLVLRRGGGDGGEHGGVAGRADDWRGDEDDAARRGQRLLHAGRGGLAGAVDDDREGTVDAPPEALGQQVVGLAVGGVALGGAVVGHAGPHDEDRSGQRDESDEAGDGVAPRVAGRRDRPTGPAKVRWASSAFTACRRPRCSLSIRSRPARAARAGASPRRPWRRPR